MDKNRTSFSVVNFIFSCLIIAILIIVYWSSLLVEEQVIALKEEINQLKTSISQMHELNEKTDPQETQETNEILLSEKPNKNGKNLLHPDPFMTVTLPKLLGPHFHPQGVIQQATIGRPKNLHPFSDWSLVVGWNSICTAGIAGQEVGKYETYTPDIATRMELRTNENGQQEYWIFLRNDVYWEPLNPDFLPGIQTLGAIFFEKHPVTAHDFVFYIDAIMNPYVEEGLAVTLREYLNDIEEYRALDDHTLVVRWKTDQVKDEKGNTVRRMKYMAQSWTTGLRPLARFVYQRFADGSKIINDENNPSAYRKSPIWAQNFAHHWAINYIVSCGPWLFNGLTERQISFKRNPNFYDRYAALAAGIEVGFKNAPDAIWEQFKSGELDLFEIPANLLEELDSFLKSTPYLEQEKQGLKIKRLNYLARSYIYIGWNETKPHFASKKVRQALTMAIDRERIVKFYLNGMGMQTTGTFFPFSPSYDKNLPLYPFSSQEALNLLHEEGWYDITGEGILSKNIDGKIVPFKFTLTYFVKNTLTKSICEYVAMALKKIGILCVLNGVDMSDLSRVFEEKNFDALYMGWSLGSPPEDPKQIWDSSGAKEPGSSNAIGFANREVDEIIKKLEYEDDHQKRIELYHRFDAIIYDEAPYTFLFAPKMTLLYREYVQNVFIPAENQELIPGANVGEPVPSLFWIKPIKR